VLRRAGLRIHEALALGEADLDARRGSLLVRRAAGRRPKQRRVTSGGRWQPAGGRRY